MRGLESGRHRRPRLPVVERARLIEYAGYIAPVIMINGGQVACDFLLRWEVQDTGKMPVSPSFNGLLGDRHPSRRGYFPRPFPFLV